MFRFFTTLGSFCAIFLTLLCMLNPHLKVIAYTIFAVSFILALVDLHVQRKSKV